MNDFKKLRVICVDDPVTAAIARHAAEEAQEFHCLMQHIPEQHREEVGKIVIDLVRESGYCGRNAALSDIIRVADLNAQPRSADELREIADRFGPIENEQFLLMNNEPWGHLPILEEEPTEQWKCQISKFKRELSKSARSDIERRRVRSAKTSQLSNKRTFARGGRR